MKDFKTRAVNDTRLHRDKDYSLELAHNTLQRDFAPSDEESMEYTKNATNRQQAQALLDKLKGREIAVSKVFWKDGQPTLVESTSKLNWEQRLISKGFTKPEMRGLPATDKTARIASGWEAKLDRRRRANFTLEETPTMAFKSSGHLPAHYYQDESALEAYVESLTKES